MRTTVGGSVNCWLLVAKCVATLNVGGHNATVVQLAAREEEES